MVSSPNNILRWRIPCPSVCLYVYFIDPSTWEIDRFGQLIAKESVRLTCIDHICRMCLYYIYFEKIHYRNMMYWDASCDRYIPCVCVCRAMVLLGSTTGHSYAFVSCRSCYLHESRFLKSVQPKAAIFPARPSHSHSVNEPRRSLGISRCSASHSFHKTVFRMRYESIFVRPMEPKQGVLCDLLKTRDFLDSRLGPLSRRPFRNWRVICNDIPSLTYCIYDIFQS